MVQLQLIRFARSIFLMILLAGLAVDILPLCGGDRVYQPRKEGAFQGNDEAHGQVKSPLPEGHFAHHGMMGFGLCLGWPAKIDECEVNGANWS